MILYYNIATNCYKYDKLLFSYLFNMQLKNKKYIVILVSFKKYYTKTLNLLAVTYKIPFVLIT